jgi:cardiolipin synthase
MAAFSRSHSESSYSFNNAVRLVKGGHEYFDLLENMIDAATQVIHFQTYIFLGDQTGMRVADALKRAAERGVKVYLLLDAYGSDQLTADWPNALKEAGVQFGWFAPMFWSKHFYFSRRLHHKVFVADGICSLVGGINICDRYNDTPDSPAWHDWALYCAGEASTIVAKICVEVWNKTCNTKQKILWQPIAVNSSFSEKSCLVRARRNDWVSRQLQISKSYLEMFQDAQEEIIIMSSYFLPGTSIRKAMKKALKRGVKIRVITAGKSDVWTAKQAERYLYRWMLRHGVEINEYQAHILHGKLSAYDNQWVTVGSYNVNDISAFACMELNMDVKDAAFATVAQSTLRNLINNHCKKISDADLEQNSPLNKLLQKACFYFVRIVFVLFTFYFRQEKLENTTDPSR